MKKLFTIVTCLLAIGIAVYAMYDFLVVELNELSTGETSIACFQNNKMIHISLLY